jgi:hypothetical protein
MRKRLKEVLFLIFFAIYDRRRRHCALRRPRTLPRRNTETRRAGRAFIIAI